MTTYEQMWFVIGIGGFLIFMEGALNYIAKIAAKILKRQISGDMTKVIAGVVIFALAVVYLKIDITPWLPWVMAGLLLIFAVFYSVNSLRKRKRKVVKEKRSPE